MHDLLTFRRSCSIVLLMVVSILATGCEEGDFRPDAVGPEGEIVVVIDSMLWNGSVGQALQEELGYFIPTLPAPERAFTLRPIQLTSTTLDRVRQQKNVVFVAPLTDTSSVGNFIRGRLPEGGVEAIEAGGRMVAARPDLWRRNQKVYFVAAADPEALVSTINEHGPALRDSFNVITRQRLASDMFRRGRQQGLEEELMERHQFAVNVQHDFVHAIDTTNFVWLRRILTDTWRSIFIHYVEAADPSMLTAEWVLSARDSLTRDYIQGNLGGWVEIDRRRPLEVSETDFLGRYGYEARGLWQMVGEDEQGNMIQFGMGGPFVTYAFYDQPSNRIYLIDGMVFAPGFDKREFLRQMEVIAHTFRTAEEAEGRQVAAAEQR